MISELLKTPPVDGMKIGLFGGSFNPTHEGHFELAKYALAKLQLDYIWWMVSPQNPLKPVHETGDFAERMEVTGNIARHPKFVVTGLENELGTRTTAETMLKLRPLFDRANFVWLMGADSFAGLHKWNDWRVIPATLPVAVFDRPGWTTRAHASTAAQLLRMSQVNEMSLPQLPYFKAPAWGFVSMPQRPESSTLLRANGRSGK